MTGNKDMKELLLVNSVNGAVLAATMTDLETVFKIALLASSLIWTWIKINKEWNGKP